MRWHQCQYYSSQAGSYSLRLLLFVEISFTLLSQTVTTDCDDDDEDDYHCVTHHSQINITKQCQKCRRKDRQQETASLIKNRLEIG